MAAVYLAQQRGLGGFQREVALKLTHAHLREQPNWATELLEEAKIAARIQHPNVVQVLDVDDDPLGVFLVMQYVEGDSLAGLLRHAVTVERRLPNGIGLRILDDALAGLHAAHELRDGTGNLVGLVHRDFSPQNILVGVDGVARLTDFGVAKAADRAGFTRTGTIKGKFGYMSPEQVRDRPLDRRSDVWAAGVVAWEVFAGRRLYPSGDQASTLFRIVTEKPPPLRSVRPDVPCAVEEAIASALTIDVERRCPSAEELRQRILGAWTGQAARAERSELGAYVRAARGPELTSLRRRVDERRSSWESSGQQNGEHARPAPDANAPRLLAEAPGEPRTEASVVSESVETTRRSPPQRPRWRTAGLVLGAAVLALAALRGYSFGRHPRGESEAVSVQLAGTGAPSSSAASAAPASGPELTDEAPGPSPGASVASPGSSADTLAIDSNAALVRVRINGHSVSIAGPTRQILAPYPSEAGHAAVLVDGVAADGRRASATLASGERKAHLVFRDRAPGPSRGNPAVQPPAPQSSAPERPQAPKLHDSPYE
jgi:serine/threonine protein kinase